ncbi:hypothetical protein [Fibrobacter sp. UWB12]|uniref:hypothetical protein n=1 Tax=Fibrobacter sp. UWB12 TaxID=1896203 RepID=UPI000916B576|nr:hypothetical protein [Fibrobacter sp. UWB12]SHL03520.1 hypothetical protein SAMN05720759_11440 [Fibrobacter sp. UWB12]
MNIKVEKKKYIAPCMEVVNFTQEACLLSASQEDDNGEDVPEIETFDGGFN